MILRNKFLIQILLLIVFAVVSVAAYAKSVYFTAFPVLIWASVGKLLTNFDKYLGPKQDFSLFVISIGCASLLSLPQLFESLSLASIIGVISLLLAIFLMIPDEKG